MTDQAQLNAQVRDILQRAYATLETAQYGYEDLCGKDRRRRFSGLRNAIVFGRSVTFVLQNMKSVHPEFEPWYALKQDEMKGDPLMRYFIAARNAIEKQGKVSLATTVKNIYVEDETAFGPRPPHATAFFIGDPLGGSGWKIELPNGETLKYYVELPQEVGEVTQHFADFADAADHGISGRSIEELCDLFLNRMRALVDEASERFA